MAKVKVMTLVAASALSLTVSQHAFAQDAGDGGELDQAQSDAPEQRGVQEIVVTAQRRVQNQQDVPLAITAVGADELAKSGVRDILDVKVAVPSLSIENTNGYLTSSIRGVGGNIVGPGVENQTAIYIDDVYYAFAAPALLELNSIQQIAVLKGPQGTLFGRNATAGVLQITTREPEAAGSGEFSLSYANYERVTANAYVGGEIVSGIKADLAATYLTQNEGWGKNRYTGADVYDIDHQYALRSKIVADPTALTRITLIGDYSSTRNTMATPQTQPGTINGFAPDLGEAPDLDYDAEFDGPNNQSGYSWGVSGRLEQDLGSVDFVSITAYRESSYNFDFDYDYTPRALQHIYARQEDRQFTQEIRLSNNGDGPLDWVVGAFYFDGRAGWNDFLLEIIPAGLDVYVENYQETKSYAGFGQATYEILPDTNLTLGIRYTDEEKRAVDGMTTLSTALGDVVVPAADAKVNESKWTYRASLDHRFSDQVLAYASYNTGFKSGGFNTGAPGTAPFLPEEVTAYEVGFKTDLLNRNLRFNIAAFYYDYTDIQVQVLTAGAIANTNGATAEIYGVDADFVAVLSNNLRLSGGFAWTDPTFKSYPACLIADPAGGTPGAIDPTGEGCSGNQIPLASKFSGSARLDYDTMLADGELNANVTVSYADKFYFTADNTAVNPSRTLLNTSLSWTEPSGHMTVALWGKNLLDEKTYSYQSINVGNGTYAQRLSAPRTYGATLSYRY